MKIRNDPRTQFWIVMNTEILKWIHQVEQIILVGDCNSEASEVKTWMETKGLTNIIFNLHRYSDDSITHQRSKDWRIDGIYCSDPLVANREVFLSFGRLLGDHQALWIEINGKMLLGFLKHDIILPMARNLCLVDPITIKKFNDTLHTSFVKHDIYRNIRYIYNRAIYALLTHLAWDFERLDKLITQLMNAADKNAYRTNIDNAL